MYRKYSAGPWRPQGRTIAERFLVEEFPAKGNHVITAAAVVPFRCHGCKTENASSLQRNWRLFTALLN